MMRRARWFAVVGSTTLGLAGLAGCQSMGSHASSQHASSHSSMVARGAEPEEPQSPPSLSLAPTQPPEESEDPFAPMTVDQFLPASSAKPKNSQPPMSAHHSHSSTISTPPMHSSTHSQVGYIVPPAPVGGSPAPYAQPAPMGMPGGMPGGPVVMPHGEFDMNAALHGKVSSCGKCNGVGAHCGAYTSIIDNMVIIGAADYWTNAGGLDNSQLIDKVSDPITGLNVRPIDIPDLDPQRVGGVLSVNTGVPLTPDGELCFQIGGTYIESNEGAQGFLTMGVYHRTQPGKHWGFNWGAVYDFLYDDFIDYAVGQIRIKAGYPLGSRDEIGGWFTISTNVEQVETAGRDVIVTDPARTPFDDVIVSRVGPMSQGHFFWHHIFNCGANATAFAGAREDLGGTLVLGYTGQIPITDCWALVSGGHWSKDADKDGSFDIYMGVALYPGSNARVPNTAGHRFLPYQDAANNTMFPVTIEPRYFDDLRGNRVRL